MPLAFFPALVRAGTFGPISRRGIVGMLGGFVSTCVPAARLSSAAGSDKEDLTSFFPERIAKDIEDRFSRSFEDLSFEGKKRFSRVPSDKLSLKQEEELRGILSEDAEGRKLLDQITKFCDEEQNVILIKNLPNTNPRLSPYIGSIMMMMCGFDRLPGIQYYYRISEGAYERPLPAHIDFAERDPIPDAVGLSAIRTVGSTRTIIFPLESILSKLDEEDIDILQQDIFKYYTEKNQVRNFIFHSILQKKDDFFECEYHSSPEIKDDLDEETKKKAQKALKKFSDAIDKSYDSVTFILEPGDMLIFRNRRLVHERSLKSFAERDSARLVDRFYGITPETKVEILDVDKVEEVRSASRV